MKLSGTRVILLLILVALVAGNIYLGIAYYQDRDREDTLADDIAAVESQIRGYELSYDIDALEVDLVNLQQQLAAAHFPLDVEYNTIHDYVGAAVEETGVDFESWEAEEDAIEKAVNGTGQEYRLFSYDATISGTLDEIFDFLAEMEANAPYETITLGEVELTYDSNTLTWSMAFTILVYAQPE